MSQSSFRSSSLTQLTPLTNKNAESSAEIYHNVHGITCGHAFGRYEHSPPRERPEAVRLVPGYGPHYDGFYARSIQVAGSQPAPQPDLEASLAKLAREKDQQMERMLATLEADTSAQTGELRELLDYRSNKIQLLEVELERLKANSSEVEVLNQQIRLLERRLEDSQKQTDLRQITVEELELKLNLAQEWATATRNSCVNDGELEERVRLARAEEQEKADDRVSNMCKIKDEEIERLILSHEEKMATSQHLAKKAAKDAMDKYRKSVECETLDICLAKRDEAVRVAMEQHVCEPAVEQIVLEEGNHVDPLAVWDKEVVAEEVEIEKEEEVVAEEVEIEKEEEGLGLFDDADATPQLTRDELHPQLIEAFDKLDEEGAEMAPRLDLRQSVDTFIPQCAHVQVLSDTVRNLDAMIVERDEYVELVNAWKDA